MIVCVYSIFPFFNATLPNKHSWQLTIRGRNNLNTEVTREQKELKRELQYEDKTETYPLKNISSSFSLTAVLKDVWAQALVGFKMGGGPEQRHKNSPPHVFDKQNWHCRA